uniref:Uncharacterized protein n=1 Tax=Timema monikensis TaxID=170555 RepID=A0A7R9EBB2_9NEOP|nr:unnamed protein product [Timema monikensis]
MEPRGGGNTRASHELSCGPASSDQSVRSECGCQEVVVSCTVAWNLQFISQWSGCSPPWTNTLQQVPRTMDLGVEPTLTAISRSRNYIYQE